MRGERSARNSLQSNARCVAQGENLRRNPRAPYLIHDPFQLFGRNQVCLAQHNPRFDMAFTGHHQVSIEPRQIEIISTSLDDKSHVDVGCDHLEIDGLARTLATQETLSRQNCLNNGRAAGGMAFDAHPIADARQVDSRFCRETNLACQFCERLSAIIPHEERSPINRSDAGNALPWLLTIADAVLKPFVEAHQSRSMFSSHKNGDA